MGQSAQRLGCRFKTLGVNDAGKGPGDREAWAGVCTCVRVPERARHVAEVGISGLVRKAVGSGTQTGAGVGVRFPEAGRLVCGAGMLAGQGGWRLMAIVKSLSSLPVLSPDGQ